MAKYNKDLYILERIVEYCEEIERTTTRFGKLLKRFEMIQYIATPVLCVFCK